MDRKNWICEFKLLKQVLKHAIDKIQTEMFVMPRINNKYTKNVLLISGLVITAFLIRNIRSFIKMCS